MQYYTSKSTKGLASISSNVFTSIASETLKGLANGDLKDDIALKDGKKSGKVITTIENNKVVVEAQIFMTSLSSSTVSSERIQKDIYEAIYSITEISSLKVNVTVLGYILK